ncbi:diaminobutyrate--2-oxoglutarate transaminase [Pseudomonas cedrina subsp. fulgida]|nr:diaminobutyrate--2-oxoglutarate transaminase [Pseudomonas cedrina subsp. fulgida]
MPISSLNDHLKSWRNGVTFAYLNFKDHPRGHEMLATLMENGHIPSIVIEEFSDSGIAEVLEQQRLLSVLTEYRVREPIESLCERNKIPYFTVGDINNNECLQHIKNDAVKLIVLGDTRIIKPRLINELEIGIINVHPGLLPEVRGNNPYVWSAIEGSPQGVTVHFIDNGIGTGPILLKMLLPGIPKDYPTLVMRLNSLCAQALARVLNNFKKGAISLTLQSDYSCATRKKASENNKKHANEILKSHWKNIKNKEALNTFNTHESRVKTYCRNFPTLLKKAQGSYIFNANECAYIDFLSAAGSLNYGHNDPDILNAVTGYLDKQGIVQSLDLHTQAKQDFIETFLEVILKPRGLEYKFLFPGPTGTNAVEAAFKLARKFTGRRNIVSFSGAFHGMSIGALAATTNSRKRAGAGVSLTNVTILPYENSLSDNVDCGRLVEQMLINSSFGIDPPAAFILEVIQGEGGLSTASTQWLKRIAALCRKVGALLIVDEIQCGCGRSGNFFSFEDSGIEPDIILLSKSLSGFGTPLSLVLVKEEHDVLDPGEHNGTFRGNNLGFIGATAAIEKFWRTEELQISIHEKSRQIINRTNKLVDTFGPKTLQYVGRGLLCGIRFTNPSIAPRLTNLLFERGFIIETCGAQDEVLKILPSLVIDSQLIDQLFDAIFNCLADIFGEIR